MLSGYVSEHKASLYSGGEKKETQWKKVLRFLAAPLSLIFCAGTQGIIETLAGPSTRSLPSVKEPLFSRGSGCQDDPEPNKHCLYG